MTENEIVNMTDRRPSQADDGPAAQSRTWFAHAANAVRSPEVSSFPCVFLFAGAVLHRTRETCTPRLKTRWTRSSGIPRITRSTKMAKEMCSIAAPTKTWLAKVSCRCRWASFRASMPGISRISNRRKVERYRWNASPRCVWRDSSAPI